MIDETVAAPKTPRRRILHIAVWAVTAGFAVVTGWRLFGPEPALPFVLLMAYTPYLAVLALIGAGLAAWRRVWPVLGVFAGCALMLGFLVVPRAVPDDIPGGDGPSLTVMTTNLMVGEADPGAIVSAVADADVDVLAVQELTEPALDGLADAGLAAELPYRVTHPDELAAGSAVYSRYPVTETPEAAFDGIFWTTAIRIEVPGAVEVRFRGVHIAAPASFARMPDWSAELAAIPPPGDSGVDILAGDFNSTLDHRAFRDVLDTGWTDAADTTGDGWDGTWRQVKAPLPVVLDHVLTGPGVAARTTSTVDVPGTDHKGLVVRLSLPGK